MLWSLTPHDVTRDDSRMTTYRRKQQEVEAVQYNSNDDNGALQELGCEMYNSNNNLPLVRVGPGENVEDGALKEVQIGWYVTKSLCEFDQYRYEVMSGDELTARFDTI
jgi:hypothetical protein